MTGAERESHDIARLHHDFFAVDDGVWLVWYWLALTGVLAYALAYSAYLFWPVLYETKMRTMVAGYILASACGVLASKATPGCTAAALSAVTGLPLSDSVFCSRKYST